jgi:DEAD/DEAH box helicase domain-containing protein
LNYFIAALDPPLSETIKKALHDSRKITSLYSHQAAAIDGIAQGKNVIVSTSTASGKSIIYQVPHIVQLAPFILINVIVDL